MDWIKGGLHLNVGNTHKTNTFWCSALVSYLYYKLGLIREVPWTIISPKELGTESENTKKSKDSIEFINCIVDKEIKIN